MSENKEKYLFENSDNHREAFAIYLSEYMENNHLTISALSKKSDIPYHSLYQWLKGISSPIGKNRKKIVDLLGKSEFELFGETTDDKGNVICSINNDREILSTNILYLINKNNSTIQDFGKGIGITYDEAVKISSGKKSPDDDLLLKIGDYFDISPKELYSHSLSNKLQKEEKQRLKLIFSSNLREIIEKKGISTKSIQEDLDIPAPSFFGYYSGKTMPSTERIEQLAQYLDVTTSQLIDSPEVIEKSIMRDIVSNIPKNKRVSFKKYMDELFSEFEE